MAGKSTLMEFLTHGDGKTIGNGSQRTTRNIRNYKWNSLEVTDVPGIGAFEGQEDEIHAFDTAKAADLILFLLTDDAPQATEAEFFSRIIDLGKPVLCIVNVKTTINIDDDMELTLVNAWSPLHITDLLYYSVDSRATVPKTYHPYTLLRYTARRLSWL